MSAYTVTSHKYKGVDYMIFPDVTGKALTDMGDPYIVRGHFHDGSFKISVTINPEIFSQTYCLDIICHRCLSAHDRHIERQSQNVPPQTRTE